MMTAAFHKYHPKHLAPAKRHPLFFLIPAILSVILLLLIVNKKVSKH